LKNNIAEGVVHGECTMNRL